LFTATTMCRMPSSCAMYRWRLPCDTRPFAASASTTAQSALLAPVAMLRVYCSWPGVSAMMNLRRGVAK
jgi:hypothetical protein